MEATRVRRLASWLGIGAATVAFVAALGTAALAAKASSANHELTGSTAPTSAAFRAGALAAARQVAVDVAAYDYRHISDDFNHVSLESTGAFHKQWLTQSAAARDLIVRAKAVSTAQISGAGLGDVAPGRVTAVVALTRTISNANASAPQSEALGMQIVLVRQHDRWLASAVTLL